VNRIHRWLCRSAYWKSAVERRILPWVLQGVALGSKVLELGPGPGVTTDILRARVTHLTCVEIDPALANDLALRMAGQNVTVLCEDATAMSSLPDATFDSAVSLTMLHHVPSPALQDCLLREVARVLRPGGIFVGADTRSSTLVRLFHVRDVLVPIDPAGLSTRLRTAGFMNIQVVVTRRAFRFRAQRG
jgi:SAM-dependent methyltransferase